MGEKLSEPQLNNLVLDLPPKNILEPHLAVALVLDVSKSMNSPVGDDLPINLLNDSVNAMVREIKDDDDHKLRTIIDLSIFTFGEPPRQNPFQGFRAIEDVEDIHLEANDHSTYIATALDSALERLRDRIKLYAMGGGAYKPWIIVITDGEFQDSESDLDRVGLLMRERESTGKLNFFGFGTGNYNRQQLERFCLPEQTQIRVIDIREANIPECFHWIGKSMKTVFEPNFPDPVMSRIEKSLKATFNY